jgi:hypothetical protein
MTCDSNTLRKSIVSEPYQKYKRKSHTTDTSISIGFLAKQIEFIILVSEIVTDRDTKTES